MMTRSELRSMLVIQTESPKAALMLGVGGHFVFGAAVVVLVQHVGGAAGGAGGTDDFKLRILGLNGIEELAEAAFIAAGLAIELVLVADFDVFRREGRGMAVLGAAHPPDRVRAADDVLDLVEGVGDVGHEVGAGRSESTRLNSSHLGIS